MGLEDGFPIVSVLGMALCWYCESPGNKSKPFETDSLGSKSFEGNPLQRASSEAPIQDSFLVERLVEDDTVFGKLPGCPALGLSETYVSTQKSS